MAHAVRQQQPQHFQFWLAGGSSVSTNYRKATVSEQEQNTTTHHHIIVVVSLSLSLLLTVAAHGQAPCNLRKC
jgi:hypothetical protein